MATNASTVFYTTIDTPTIPILVGQTLDVILQNIDTAINTHNTAPDYSGYNLYCVTQVDGTSHPTNTQNFAEGISKNLCDFNTAYTTFTGTTYVTDKGVFTSAITALQAPGLTYTPFSIVSSDTISQVYAKQFTGFTGILGSQDPSGGTWSTLSITPPTTITTGFNSLIAYISGMDSIISGKQSTISNIDNSSNCLSSIGGTNSDTIRATVLLLTTLSCSLPVYSAGSVTWGGVSTGTNLQTSIQNVVNSISSILTNVVVSQGTGLSISAVGTTYQGKKLSIDTTYTQLYKTMVDSSDTTADFLSNKLIAGTGITISTQNSGGNETLLFTNSITTTSEVKVNSSDATPGYLATKIPSTGDTSWGLILNSFPSADNSTLQLVPTIGNPYLFGQAFMDYIATDPQLLTQFAGLIQLSASAPGTPVGNLIVSLSSTTFDLAWTHQSGSAQNAKWRQTGQSSWILTGFSVPNPLSGTVAANTISAPSPNFVFDFQIDTVYATGTIGSNIAQMIDYIGQTLTYAVNGGVIGVNQSALPQIDTIQYRLRNAGGILQNVNTTGAIPNIAFTSVSAGSYTVEWRYGTLVNATTLYSDDASQHAAWYSLSVTV